MENQNGSFRPKTNFAAVSNNALKDSRLSLKAKGLYALIQSYITLPGIRLSKSILRNKCLEKEKAFDSAWKELKDTGYLKQYRQPSGENDTFIYEYDLLDEANEEQPALTTLNKQGKIVGQTAPNQHTPHNGGGADSEPQQNGKEAVNPHTPHNGGSAKPHTPHFAPYASGTRCGSHRVPNGGDIDNTKLANIDRHNTKLFNNQSVSQAAEQTKPVPPEGAQTDGQTDKIRNELMKQIDFDWIAETHPEEIDSAKALINCMVEMLSSPYTKINRISQSRYALQKLLSCVAEDDIVDFIDHIQSRGIQSKNIRNLSAYYKSAFINYLEEKDLAVATV